MSETSPGAESTAGEVTVMLERWVAGDEQAVDELLHRVYGELRKLADQYLRRERDGHTLAPTALVHEAYLRLLGSELEGATVENRSHFFAVAARAMRRILVEHARRYQADRRASPKDRVILEDGADWGWIEPPPTEILALDQALDQPLHGRVAAHRKSPDRHPVLHEPRGPGALGGDRSADVLPARDTRRRLETFRTR